MTLKKSGIGLLTYVFLLSALASRSIAADYQLLETLPHKPPAFTQGFEFHQGRRYESSGLYGRSLIFYHDANGNGQFRKLPDKLFAEGLTVLHDRLYLLTWKAGRCLILDPDTLQLVAEQSYQGEGWGLTNNGQQLIMSNGSAMLSFIDPDSWQIKRRLLVHHRGKPVRWLNELEWHGGLILANQWQSDRLFVIDETTGQVLKIIDLSDLYPVQQRKPSTDVMNGIAYDPASDSWLVTGKFWPLLYRLRLDLPYPSPAPAAR